MESIIPSSEGNPTNTSNYPTVTMEAWIVAIWFSGFVIMLWFNFFNYFRFKRKALQGTRIDRVGNLNVLISPNVHSPMLIGFIKPQIVFPITNMSTADYELALKHELIHHKQKGPGLNFLL